MTDLPPMPPCPYGEHGQHELELVDRDEYVIQACVSCGMARTFGFRPDQFDGLTADDIERRFLGMVEVDSGTLLIPNNPAVRGLYVGAQIAAGDRGSTNTLPLVFTNGLRVTVF